MSTVDWSIPHDPENLDHNLFNASSCVGVEKGIVVMLQEGHLVYAGHIKGAPKVDGCLLLLHPADFEILQHHVNGKRH